MPRPIHALIACLALTAPAAAQQPEHAHHASPYADQEASGIAALSAGEVEQLRTGAGMGMARAAELNQYPGPKHVLEMAEELLLTPEQKDAIQAAHDAMLAEAQRLGEAILEQEAHLQRRFAHHHIDQASLRQATAEIARLYGELRFAHLAAHLETTARLSAEQVESYDRLRGYR